MKIIELIRLLQKHIVLLILTPLVLASLVFLLTRKPHWQYASETTLYTGIATGTSVEMDKSFNFFATNTAFDNLINVIKSRETQQEVAIRLLSQHLLLGKADPKYISAKSFAELKRITPSYIYPLVAKNSNASASKNDSVMSHIDPGSGIPAAQDSFSFETFNDLSSLHLFPPSINQADYERTVINLTNLMESSDTNFVYKLLNYPTPHYSYKDISSIKVQRIANSDLVQLDYETDDPGICQQTLALLTEVCIRNYKNIKENRSDAVVKYFEYQLKMAAERLRVAEDKLLEFNKANNIINYYEQSKAVAVVKEDLDVDYNNKKIKLAGIEAAIKRLEEKLDLQQQIQLNSSQILDKKNQLGDLNYKIASAEAMVNPDSINPPRLADLKNKAERLKHDIRSSVSELYRYGNSTDGLPISTVLNDWINNVIEAENVKAGINVLGERIKEFQKQYAIYAPAGANIKRIEREISVSEQEFLELLHGLNQAKLKMQDNELSSNIKAVDPPYFPLSPLSTKRGILIIVAALLGFILVLGSILVMEYFDDTMKNPAKAARILKLPFLGVLPKILLKVHKLNFSLINNRLLEITIQNIELFLRVGHSDHTTKTLLFFSTLDQEGKTTIAGNLGRKLKLQGKKILLLKYQPASLQRPAGGIGGNPEEDNLVNADNGRKRNRPGILNLILGYPDSRIDIDSPLLADPAGYLSKDECLNYRFDDAFCSASSYTEILELNHLQIGFIPDYVLIVIPPVLYYPYPADLLMQADMQILVCRSNRIWSHADQSALEVLLKLSAQKTHFFLNGVAPTAIETVLGDLPQEKKLVQAESEKHLPVSIFFEKSFLRKPCRRS